MVDGGLPPFVVEQLICVFEALRDGQQATTTDTVRQLTGRAPRSFAAFAAEYVGAFRSEQTVSLSS